MDVTGIFTLKSGQPFTVGSGVDNARSGTGGQLADLVGDPSCLRSSPRSASPSGSTRPLFTQRPRHVRQRRPQLAARAGLSRRRRGPSQEFTITESFKLQFRAEAFNIFNRVNLNNPNADRSSGNFGRILTALDPRILQFALRPSL